MVGPIIEILIGFGIWFVLPSMIKTKKKNRKKVAFVCNVIGALIVVVGAVHLLMSVF